MADLNTSDLSDTTITVDADAIDDICNTWNQKVESVDLESIDANVLESNIRTALRKNIESGTIAPTFILEIEALLRTILGY